jgi:hypothetical protein
MNYFKCDIFNCLDLEDLFYVSRNVPNSLIFGHFFCFRSAHLCDETHPFLLCIVSSLAFVFFVTPKKASASLHYITFPLSSHYTTMPDLLDTVFEAIENTFHVGTSTAPPPPAPNKPSWFAVEAPPPPLEEEKDLLDTVFGAIENSNCPVPPSSSSSQPTPPAVSSFPWDAFQTPDTSSSAEVPASEEKKTKKNKKKRGWENKWETIGFFHNPMAPSEEHVAQQKMFDEQAKRQKDLEEQLAQKEHELKVLQQQQQQFRLALLQQQSEGGGDVDFLETVFSKVENGVCPNSSNHPAAGPLMIAADQEQPNQSGSADPLPLLHPRRDHEPQFHGFVIHKLRQDYKSLADALDSGMSTVSSALLSRKSNQRSTAPESISVVKVKKNKFKFNNNNNTADVSSIPRLPEKDNGDVIDHFFESFEAGIGLESSADALYKAHVALALQAQQEVALYKALVQQQQEEEKRLLKEQKVQQRRMEQEQVRVAELETRTEAAADEPRQLDLLDSVFEAFEWNLCAASTGTATAVH